MSQLLELYGVRIQTRVSSCSNVNIINFLKKSIRGYVSLHNLFVFRYYKALSLSEYFLHILMFLFLA
jgi:hypothetical protein